MKNLSTNGLFQPMDGEDYPTSNGSTYNQLQTSSGSVLGLRLLSLITSYVGHHWRTSKTFLLHRGVAR